MWNLIDRVKEKIIYISAKLLDKKGMDIYNLSQGVIFYRDPIDSETDIHQVSDLKVNPFYFRNLTEQIIASGGEDGPEDWAGAFNLSKNLSWRNDSLKFIIHIADAPAHGHDWINPNYYYDDDLNAYPEEGNKTDEIITYFAQNNFSIAGFKVNDDYSSYSYKRAQTLYRNNGNFNYFFKYFDDKEKDDDYFLDSVYGFFQKILNVKHLKGIDVSEEQNNINWETVKNENIIDFAIIRAGIGNEIDKKFEQNYNETKKYGIPIGVYWEAKGWKNEDAIKEAEACKNILEGKKFEFPIYYVIDDDSILNTGNEGNVIITFCNSLYSSDSTNYLCGLGSSKIEDHFSGKLVDKYEIWNTNYDEEPKVIDVDYNMWRYNKEGTIKGIDGKVSLVESIIDYEKITTENNYNGY